MGQWLSGFVVGLMVGGYLVSLTMLYVNHVIALRSGLLRSKGDSPDVPKTIQPELLPDGPDGSAGPLGVEPESVNPAGNAASQGEPAQGGEPAEWGGGDSGGNGPVQRRKLFGSAVLEEVG